VLKVPLSILKMLNGQFDPVKLNEVLKSFILN